MAGWQQERASMARVRYLERADLAPEHQPLYDEIAASRGSLPPNFKALLHSPVASARMAVLGAYVRFETPLPARIKALAGVFPFFRSGFEQRSVRSGHMFQEVPPPRLVV